MGTKKMVIDEDATVGHVLDDPVAFIAAVGDVGNISRNTKAVHTRKLRDSLGSTPFQLLWGLR